MAKGGNSHSIVLMDRSSTNKTGLKLLRNAEGALQYQVDLAPALAPDVPPEDLAYAQYQPEMELIWQQRSWHEGGLKFYYEHNQPGRYGIADKVWAATPNELSMGMMAKAVPFGVRNGAAELGATTGWDSSGVTLSVATTAPYCGVYHFNATSMSTNDYVQATVQQTEQPIARWVNQSITAFARVRGSEAGGTVRLDIIESGGSSTPTTSGSTADLTASYQVISSGAVTIQGDTTGIVIKILMTTNGGSDRTLYFDLVQVLPGSTIPNASNAQMKQMDTDLVAVTDKAVWLFNETYDYFALAKVHAQPIKGVEVYDDQLYIGQGESTAYEYSNADDATTWTASNLSSTQKNANLFAKSPNALGNWALAKTLNDDDVHLSTDPTNSGSWGNAVEVGKDDHDILQAFQVDGTLAIGKEDGFYMYLTLDGNRFVNIYPGADQAISSDNFSRGIMFNGDLYTIMNEVGFLRYRGESWEDLAHLIQSPGFNDFGNRIRAFGTDGRWLYVLVEDLNSDSITKSSWLYAMLEREGVWEVHQLCSLILSDAIDIFTHKPSGASNRFLYINGDINDAAAAYRIPLPHRTDTPRHATNADMALSGEFVTSYWDANRPQVRKVFNRLTLISENLSTTRTITVAYQVDDDTTWTNMNSSSSAFTISSRQSIAFNENVVGTRIRFRFTFDSTSSTAGPVLKAFIMEANWRPRRLRRWQLVAAVEEDIRSLAGIPHALPASRLSTRLEILRSETAPLQLEDIDGVTHRCHIVDKVEREFMVRAGANGTGPRYSRAISLTLSEAFTVSGQPWDSGIRWTEFHWG